MSQLKNKPAPRISYNPETRKKHTDAFERTLPMSLLRARKKVMKYIVPILSEHELTPEQMRTIRALEKEDGLEFSELALRSHVLTPSMTRIVKNLESRGLIERKVIKSDQRRYNLYLTDKGIAVINSVTPRVEVVYNKIVHSFGKAKFELLSELLEDFNEIEELIESEEPD